MRFEEAMIPELVLAVRKNVQTHKLYFGYYNDIVIARQRIVRIAYRNQK